MRRCILGMLVLVLAAGGNLVRAETVATKVAVPSYFYPGPKWDQLNSHYPLARLAIINPDSGPGAERDPRYAAQVRESRSAGLIVLAYVYTNYGNRPIADVKADVATYYARYRIDGIFFDEVSTSCAVQPYYAELRDYNRQIKTWGKRAKTVINPGTQTNRCYAPVADIICTFESSYADYLNDYSAPAWVNDYPADKFWHLVYGAPNGQAIEDAAALSRQRHAGWFYATRDTLPNPWDTLPQPAVFERMGN